MKPKMAWAAQKTVRLLAFEDMPKTWQDRQPRNGCGREFANYLVIHDAVGNIEEVYSDAAEPEDLNLARDLSWVLDLAGRMVAAENALAKMKAKS